MTFVGSFPVPGRIPGEIALNSSGKNSLTVNTLAIVEDWSPGSPWTIRVQRKDWLFRIEPSGSGGHFTVRDPRINWITASVHHLWAPRRGTRALDSNFPTIRVRNEKQNYQRTVLRTMDFEKNCTLRDLRIGEIVNVKTSVPTKHYVAESTISVCFNYSKTEEKVKLLVDRSKNDCFQVIFHN